MVLKFTDTLNAHMHTHRLHNVSTTIFQASPH